MPNLFIVRGQQSAVELAAALLPSRASTADRSAAAAALAAANPTVDLDRLRPGAGLVVRRRLAGPAFEGSFFEFT